MESWPDRIKEFEGEKKEKLMPKALARARDILRIVEIGPELPDGDFLAYLPSITSNIYQHVRIYASRFSELCDYVPVSGITKEVLVAHILIDIWEMFKIGISDVVSRYGEEAAKSFGLADVVLCGFRNSPEQTKSLYSHAHFFILSLDHLVDFSAIHFQSFRPKKKFKTVEDWESSAKTGIDAMGHLLAAQSALELGIYKMMESQTKERVDVLLQEALQTEKRVVEQRDHSLQMGRSLGTAARVNAAAKRRENISQMVRDLFERGEGWRMSNSQISNYLKRRLDGYPPSTIETQTKKVAAEIRRKARQA